MKIHGHMIQKTSTMDGEVRPAQYIIIREEQPSGTIGGTFTAGAWRTRILNTIAHDDTGEVTLSSNQFVLPAGTYRIVASLPVYAVWRHTGRLQNITDSEMTLQSIPGMAHATYGGTERSIIAGTFTISASKTFEIQHYCDGTKAVDGLGTANVAGQGGSPLVNIYTNVELWKIA